MRKTITLILGGAALVLAGVALADSSNGSNDPNEVICQPGKPPTGSRIVAPPECHTRAQWDQISHDAQQNLDKQQRTLSSPPK